MNKMKEKLIQQIEINFMLIKYFPNDEIKDSNTLSNYIQDTIHLLEKLEEQHA